MINIETLKKAPFTSIFIIYFKKEWPNDIKI